MLFLSENLIEVRPESLLFRVLGPLLPSLLEYNTKSLSNEDPQGFGEEASKAISALNGTQMGGRTLTVNEAKPQEPRSGGGGGDRGGRGGFGGGGGGNRDRW